MSCDGALCCVWHPILTHPIPRPTEQQQRKYCPSVAAVKTHRELFADFYASLFGSSLESLIAEGSKVCLGPVVMVTASAVNCGCRVL